MEIRELLPKIERNSFANPEQHLGPTFRRQDFVDLHEHGLDISGTIVLDTIRVFKLKKVNDLVVKCSERCREHSILFLGYDIFTRFCTGCFTGPEGYTICAIKYLANDGFLKLKVAERFEDSVVVQYHATAKPDFRDGEFQL